MSLSLEQKKKLVKDLHDIAQKMLKEGMESGDDVFSRLGGTIQLMLIAITTDDFDEMMGFIGNYIQAKMEHEKNLNELLKGISLN